MALDDGMVFSRRITVATMVLLVSFYAAYGAGNQGDLFYVPAGARRSVPALIILSCTGATQADLDSCRPIADSLGWALATCAKAATTGRRVSTITTSWRPTGR